jgi:hypothetical protein
MGHVMVPAMITAMRKGKRVVLLFLLTNSEVLNGDTVSTAQGKHAPKARVEKLRCCNWKENPGIMRWWSCLSYN